MLTCLVLLQAAAAVAADWPQYLGPSRDGSSAEKGLIDHWDVTGPRVVWKVPCGKGQSQLVVANGRVFTLAERGDVEVALALDVASGAELWSRPVGKRSRRTGSSATPAIDGSRLYVQAVSGPMHCLDAESGRIVWTVDIAQTFGARFNSYGTTNSPLVEGDRIILFVGGKDGVIAALDKNTGKTIWNTVGNEATGFSSPVMMEVAGKKQVVCLTASSLFACDPEKGNLLWHTGWGMADGDAASPIVIGNRFFVSHAGPPDCAVFEPTANALNTVWRSTGGKCVLANWWSSSVSHDGYVYGIDDGERLKCVDAATGKLIWTKEHFGEGNLSVADGKLYVVTLKGELVVIRASPARYDETARVKLLGTTEYNNAPSIAGKRLFARDQKNIVCVDLASR